VNDPEVVGITVNPHDVQIEGHAFHPERIEAGRLKDKDHSIGHPEWGMPAQASRMIDSSLSQLNPNVYRRERNQP
jgi:hypothetical protein